MRDMTLDDLQGEIGVEHLLTYADGRRRRVFAVDLEVPFPEGRLIVSRTDPSGVITQANESFVAMSGYSIDELIGQPHYILRHPDMPKAAFADLWTTVDQGKRWLTYLAQAWQSPLGFQRALRKRLKQTYKRSRLRNFLQTWLAPKDAGQTIDVPLDGPDVDAEFNRFAASPNRLPTRLLVVCATKEPRPEWSTVAPDQGWCGRAEEGREHRPPGDRIE